MMIRTVEMAAIVGSIWSRSARNMLRVIVELSPPETNSEMMISSKDVRKEISDAEISENLICGSVISIKAFIEITLPQIKFSLISASLISFLTSFDEIIISLFVSGGDNSTITRSMFLALRDQIDPTIAAISTVLIIISSGLLVMSQFLGSKSR